MGVIADLFFWSTMNGFGSALTMKEMSDKSMSHCPTVNVPANPMFPAWSMPDCSAQADQDKMYDYLMGKFTASKWWFACYFIEMLLFTAAVGLIPFMKNKFSFMKNKSSKFNMVLLCACLGYVGIELLQFIINMGVAPGMDCPSTIDGKCTDGWASEQQTFKDKSDHFVCAKYNAARTECEAKYYGTDVYMIQFGLARRSNGACLTFQVFGLLATAAVAGVMGWMYTSPNEMEAPNAEKPAFDYGAI